MTMTSEQKFNILLVDDQPENLMALEVVLQPLGQNLVKAHSGREALRHLLTMNFAVIILDVQMPDMDGFETATMIRERERTRQTPIIFLTAARTTDAHVFKGYAVGAVDYLVKPIEEEILRSKVAAFVELARKTELLEAANRRLTEAHQELKRAQDELSKAYKSLEASNVELEARVEARTREMAKANRDLETLLYVVSHDLKEPLRSIDNFSVLLRDRCVEAVDERGKDYIARIVRAVARLERAMDDILRLSRVRKVEPPTEEIPGETIVRAAMDRLEDKIRKTGAHIRVMEDLPDLRVDKTWGTEAVYNLLDNALKFTRPGAPPDIEIAAHHSPEGEPDEAGIVVRDRGPGILPEFEGKIFELFKRGVGREVEGTGAGLAIVRKIAERHGGRAWHRPRDGGGLEFGVTFGRQVVLSR